jgi:hypothetical protein
MQEVWREHWSARAALGAEQTLATIEYGPTPYTPMLPCSQVPVADQVAVIHDAKEHLEQLFFEWKSASSPS